MENNKNFFTTTGGIITIIIVVLCCCCIVLLGSGLAGIYYFNTQVTIPAPDATPFTLDVPTPTSLPVVVTRVPVEDIPTDTLSTLEQTIVPENNPRDLACRLEGKCNIPETLPSGPFKAGDKQKFWVTNNDTATSFQVDATLVYITEHAYFWVEDGVKYDQKDAEALVDTFTEKMYPTDREFFGSEWFPGVDEDPHIYILYTRGIGAAVAGYFSSVDSFPPDAAEYSNAHEMFVFNADNSPLDDSYTYGVLAHEFQHMIHFNQDRNESSWINEGFSELAMLLNGYTVGFADNEYASDPDIQLTDWGSNPGTNGPHYGSSFLFLTYFLDRFGEEATKMLVHDQQNGMDSVDDVLKAVNATDPVTGKSITANDLFMDWAVTNYLLDGSVSDGRYVYKRYSNAPQMEDTERFESCPTDYTSTVHQYGVDYLHFSCSGKVTLHFEGATQTSLLPADAYSGVMSFWSNKGDESDMTLTHEFDFINSSSPLTLKYRTWYDIEKDWDYVYVEASTDGGKTWQILTTPSGTDTDPSGNSYGWGYTGKTRGWIEESVNLGQFAGQNVQLRFEYVTDAAVNGEGFLLDDVSIPEINYFTDFEADDGGWQAAGFARVQNVLPQIFRLALITKGSETKVQTIEVAPDQTAEISLDFGSDLTDAILVVSGTTRFTRGEGSYTVSVK
jgi:hypothetical protein